MILSTLGLLVCSTCYAVNMDQVLALAQVKA